MQALGLGLGLAFDQGVATLGVSVLARADLIFLPSAIHNDGSGKVDSYVNAGPAGSSWNLAQATPANRPAYSATAGKNGGPAMVCAAASATNLITTGLSRAEPLTLLIRARNNGDASAFRVLADGTAANTRLMRVEQTTQSAIIYGGATLASGATWSTNAWHVFGGVFNGVASIVNLDGTSATGADGGGAATGLTVGARGGAAVGWEGPIDYICGWLGVLTAAELEAARAVIGMAA